VKSKTTLPKGVWFASKKLASGEVVRYGYFGRGAGMEALGREGGADFHFRLAEVLRRAPEEGKVSHLIWRYRSSAEFKALRDLTRRDYNRHLDKIQQKFGKLRIAALEAPQISDVIYAWRDKLAEASPRQADYTISVMGAMLKWSKKRGLISENRASGIEDVYKADRTDKFWTPEQEARLLGVAPAHIQRAVILAAETGLSQEDLLVLRWADIQGKVITASRLKNGNAAAIPISPRLAAMLAAAPRTAEVILTGARGAAMNPKGNGLRSDFALARAKAGIEDRTFHDLRGTFITRRRAMGWTAEETALCSGHKVAGEAGAQSAYVSRKEVAMQNAIRLWTRYYGPKRELLVQTDLQTKAPKGRAKSV
jgi:integrase